MQCSISMMAEAINNYEKKHTRFGLVKIITGDYASWKDCWVDAQVTNNRLWLMMTGAQGYVGEAVIDSQRGDIEMSKELLYLNFKEV